MGYLSQRKKFARTNVVLQFLLIVLGLLTFVAFCDGRIGELINTYRLQIYLTLIVIILYSLYTNFFLYSFIALILTIINFFVITSSANIIFKEKYDNQAKVSIMYQKSPSSIIDSFELASKLKTDAIAITNPLTGDLDVKGLLPEDYYLSDELGKMNSFISIKDIPDLAGIIRLSPNNTSAFSTLNTNGINIIFIVIDFKNLNTDDIEKSLSKIEAFIASRDEPVIIMGDFSTTAWSSHMTNFLEKTGLYIKNPLLTFASNILFAPTFYILGYKHLSFEGLTSQVPGDNQYKPYLIKLGL